MSSRFIADENVDAAIVIRLRSDGADVSWVAEMAPGVDDDRVLALANDEARILVTSDHDFGELVFRLGRATHGVLLLRLDGLSAERKVDIVATTVTAHGDELLGAFSVVTPAAVRIRKRQ